MTSIFRSSLVWLPFFAADFTNERPDFALFAPYRLAAVCFHRFECRNVPHSCGCEVWKNTGNSFPQRPCPRKRYSHTTARNLVPPPMPCHSGITASRVARQAPAVNNGATAKWATGSPSNSFPDFINLKFDRRATLKAVPIVKPGLRCIIYPTGLQPFDNIIRTGEQNNLSASAPPCLCEGCRSDFCDLADVNGPLRSFAYETCQSCSEFFSVTQNRKRS